MKVPWIDAVLGIIHKKFEELFKLFLCGSLFSHGFSCLLCQWFLALSLGVALFLSSLMVPSFLIGSQASHLFPHWFSAL